MMIARFKPWLKSVVAGYEKKRWFGDGRSTDYYNMDVEMGIAIEKAKYEAYKDAYDTLCRPDPEKAEFDNDDNTDRPSGASV